MGRKRKRDREEEENRNFELEIFIPVNSLIYKPGSSKINDVGVDAYIIADYEIIEHQFITTTEQRRMKFKINKALFQNNNFLEFQFSILASSPGEIKIGIGCVSVPILKLYNSNHHEDSNNDKSMASDTYSVINNGSSSGAFSFSYKMSEKTSADDPPPAPPTPEEKPASPCSPLPERPTFYGTDGGSSKKPRSNY